MSAPSLAVVVPSYRRPAELERCLDALARQTRPAEQVLVVLREDDTESRQRLEGRATPAELVTVREPGQVAALTAARSRLRTEIVAFTDDDCVAHPDWLERIADGFASDTSIGAIGGRDIVHDESNAVVEEQQVAEVGRVRRSTRLVGNHHQPAPPQDVDFLKGACMAVRTVCLPPYDERLRGSGAQVHNDMQSTLAIRRAGWRVLYDPTVRVDHFPAARFDSDGRERRTLAAIRDEQHNELLVLLTLLPVWQRPLALGYRLLVGTHAAPGLALALPALARSPRRRRTLREILAANGGRLAGVGTFLQTEASQ
jgi:glycosyltransferase involved in cell wall biosynthesis